MHIVTCPRFTRIVTVLTMIWVIALWMGSQPVLAQRLTSLYSFDAYPDGDTPTGSLAEGPDGAYYGVAYSGGESDAGTIFRVTASGEFSTLYSFMGRDDGSLPYLLTSGGGSFYGFTSNTLFNVTMEGALTTLHRFAATDTPQAILLGRDGRLYGVSSTGGTGQNGYIFSIGTDGTHFTTLYSFTGGLDSAGPNTLIQGLDGRLYGTAGGGGALPYGSVFRLNVSGTNFTTTYAFDYATDGETPEDLIQGADGTLYGTTTDDGLNGGGTIFRMAPDGSRFATLTSLDFNTGYSPQGLTLGPDGALYGYVTYGGQTGAGALFKIGVHGAGFHVIYLFTGTDEGGAPAGLTLSTDGLFYGTAGYGGAGRGTIFSATTAGVVTPVYALASSADGALPADIRRASDGNSYGVTYYGGIYDAGTVFRITAAGDTQTLYSFTGGNDGGDPVAAPILGKGGDLYGTVPYGGPNGTGVIYKLSPSGSLTVLHAFSAEGFGINFNLTNTDGVEPNGVVQAPDGNLYGTAFLGGNRGFGTVFRVSPTGSGFKVIHTYANGKDQSYPYGALIVGQDGSLYGTASGLDNEYNTVPTYGSVFKVTLDGRFTTLCVFTDPTVAANPAGSLVQGPDGTLYGTADYTEATPTSYGYGSIFAVAPNGSGLKNVYLFTGVNGSAYPFALILNTDGRLYGIAGYTSSGPIFSVGTDGKGYTVDYLFRSALMGFVPAAITPVGDGSLIGATEYGGAKGIGTVFHFVP